MHWCAYGLLKKKKKHFVIAI